MKKASKISEKTLMLSTVTGLVMNFFYAIANAVLGITTNSRWLITISAYYIILSIMRFSVIYYKLKNKHVSFENEMFVKVFSGYMFFALDAVLVAVTYLAVVQSTGTRYHEIMMITIATYTFVKVTFAVMNLYKSKKSKSPLLTTIRSISFADAAVSIFSLQRSMLVSFGDMDPATVRLFNTLTGSGVCLAVTALGINLIGKDKSKWQNRN